MCWFRKEQRPYKVTVHLDGRHPYLSTNELDYPTRDVVLTVPAIGWSDAAKQAYKAVRSLSYWRASVKAIEAGA